MAALLVATAAAFAYTERLKLTPSPIKGTKVDKLFSPTCECATGTARIAFRLRKRDRVTVVILNRDDRVVRTLVSDRSQRAGLVVAYWDGRDDFGQVVPGGVVQASRQARTQPADDRPTQPDSRRHGSHRGCSS